MITADHISNNAKTPPHKIGRWRLVLVIVSVALFMATPAYPAEDPLTPQVTNPVNADSNNKEGKQCTWACLKWDKLCNVDPRGVYKCRRMCANFGEVCEE